MIEFNKRNSRSWSLMGLGPSIWSVGFEEVLSGVENKSEYKILTADLERYSGLQRIDKTYENVVYNVGIAEQNMVGIAAGLVMEKYQVYMTTYAPFMTYRCADQIRHLLGNMQLPIKAIGSAAGFTAGFSGNALLALSDIAFIRSIPGMVVLSPADCTEAVKLMIAMSKMDAPVYMRYCGAIGEPIVYQEDYELEIGKPVQLVKGSKVAIFATGTTIVAEAIKAAQMIEERTGVMPNVYDVHTIKPLDTGCYEKIIEENDLIVTIEEHNIVGGLGSAVAEVMTTSSRSGRLLRLGAEDKLYLLGSRKYMLEQAGLVAEKITDRVKEWM